MAKTSCPANGAYRYGYQGEFAEKDSETDWNSFELRQYDSEIGRWLSTDPYGQYWSPYMAMGNDPSNRIDPDGGEDGEFGPIVISPQPFQIDMFFVAGMQMDNWMRNVRQNISSSLRAADKWAENPSGLISQIGQAAFSFIPVGSAVNAYYGHTTGADIHGNEMGSGGVALSAVGAIPGFGLLKAPKMTLAMVRLAKFKNIVSFGKNSSGHLIKHRDVLGFGLVSAQQAQKIIPQLKQAATAFVHGADVTLTRVGQWHGHANAVMYINNGRMLVTEANGTLITLINKTSNNWYQLATPLR